MGYSLVGADFVDDESGSSSESEADDNDVTAADGSKPVKKKTHTYKLEKCKDKTYVHCTLTVRWIRSLHLALTTKNQNNSCIGIQNTISFKLCLSFRLAACCVRVVDEDSCAFVTELLTSVRICGSIAQKANGFICLKFSSVLYLGFQFNARLLLIKQIMSCYSNWVLKAQFKSCSNIYELIPN